MNKILSLTRRCVEDYEMIAGRATGLRWGCPGERTP